MPRLYAALIAFGLSLLGGCAPRADEPRLAISPQDLENILQALAAEDLDDGKLSVVGGAVKTRHFTCAQARQILQTFTFDQSRERAALLLYPRVTDPENFFTILDVFTFEQSRNNVREQLKL